jgi:hypothetical protein
MLPLFLLLYKTINDKKEWCRIISNGTLLKYYQQELVSAQRNGLERTSLQGKV